MTFTGRKAHIIIETAFLVIVWTAYKVLNKRKL